MRLLVTIAALAATSSLAFGVAPASAKQSCGRAVLNDWYVDETIDGQYAAQCYREALSRVSDQMNVYSDLPEQLERGLQEALARKAKFGVESARTTITQPPSRAPASAHHRTTGPIQRVLGELGPDRADSLPVPLMILAGVALLLVAAGAASAVHRRLRGRRSSS